MGKALQIKINVGSQGRRRFGLLLPAHTGISHDAVARIDFHESSSLFPAELRLILLFETGFPNLLSSLVALKPWLREFLFGNLTRVPDQRGHGRPVGIVPFGGALDDQPGELDTALFEN